MHKSRQKAAIINKTDPVMTKTREMEKLPERPEPSNWKGGRLVYLGTSPGKAFYPELNQSADDIYPDEQVLST